MKCVVVHHIYRKCNMVDDALVKNGINHDHGVVYLNSSRAMLLVLIWMTLMILLMLEGFFVANLTSFLTFVSLSGPFQTPM